MPIPPSFIGPSHRRQWIAALRHRGRPVQFRDVGRDAHPADFVSDVGRDAHPAIVHRAIAPAAMDCRPTARVRHRSWPVGRYSLLGNSCNRFAVPKYRRHYVPGMPVFVTFVTKNREPWLKQDGCAEMLMDSMRRAKSMWSYQHMAVAILPDHVHWILRPDAPAELSSIVASVKRDMSWRMKDRGRTTPLWQARFWDHVIRDPEDLARHMNYVHFNPVKHGIVSRAADYPFSSFAAWVRRGVYPMEWGQIDHPPEGVGDMQLE